VAFFNTNCDDYFLFFMCVHQRENVSFGCKSFVNISKFFLAFERAFSFNVFSGPCEPIKLQSKFVIQLGGVRPSIFAKISLQATSRFLLNFDVQKNKWSVFSPFWDVCVCVAKKFFSAAAAK